MKRILILLLIFTCYCSLIFAQNYEWQTSLEEGFRLGAEENKNILVEFGLVQDGNPLFIYDDIWSDEAIVKKLASFIPVSIDLKSNRNLADKYQLYYAPSLVLLTPDGSILYKTSGMKTLFELDDLLLTFQKELKKIEKLKSIYSKDDIIGNLLLLDEYMKLIVSSPNHMEDDLMQFAKERLSLLDQQSRELDPVQKQRFKIYTHLYNVIIFGDGSQLRKLYRIGKKELLSQNHSLLLFSIAVGEYYTDEEKKAKSVHEELKKRITTDRQAAEYSTIFTKALEY